MVSGRRSESLEETKERAFPAQEMWVSKDPIYTIIDIAEKYNMSKIVMRNQIMRWREKIPGWFVKKNASFEKHKTIEDYKKDAEIAQIMWSMGYTPVQIGEKYNAKGGIIAKINKWRDILPGWFAKKKKKERIIKKDKKNKKRDFDNIEDFVMDIWTRPKCLSDHIVKRVMNSSFDIGLDYLKSLRLSIDLGDKFGIYEDIKNKEPCIYLPNKVLLHVDEEGAISPFYVYILSSTFGQYKRLSKRFEKSNIFLSDLSTSWGYSEDEIVKSVKKHYNGNIKNVFPDLKKENKKEENKKWIINRLEIYKEEAITNGDNDMALKIEEAIKRVILNKEGISLDSFLRVI